VRGEAAPGSTCTVAPRETIALRRLCTSMLEAALSVGHPLGHRSALEPGVSRQGHWGVGAPTFLFTPPASSPSLTLSEWGMRGALLLVNIINN
jgi:hypothetical protein